MLELGSYYSTLGSHVAEAEQAASLAEVHYKYERENRKLVLIQEGEKIAKADGEARVMTKDEEEEYISLRYKYRLLSLARDSLRTNIDVIRSKLSFIKSDKENQ